MHDDEWYYLQDGLSRGPHSSEALEALYHRGEVSADTLVWKLGADKWKAIREALPDIGNTPPPLPTPANELSRAPSRIPIPSLPGITREANDSVAPGEMQQWIDTTAHPWRRYFARMFDTVIDGALVMFAVGLGLELVHPETASRFISALDNNVVSGIAITLAAIPLNALLIGVTGGSLGKWLFGVRVLKLDNQPLGFSAALSREGMVWARGMGLGIPIVSLITLVTAFNTLRKTGRSSWDSDLALKVVHRPKGVGQLLLGFVGAAGFLFVFVGLTVLSKLK